jgi:hypothetical protein
MTEKRSSADGSSITGAGDLVIERHFRSLSLNFWREKGLATRLSRSDGDPMRLSRLAPMVRGKPQQSDLAICDLIKNTLTSKEKCPFEIENY